MNKIMLSALAASAALVFAPQAAMAAKEKDKVVDSANGPIVPGLGVANVEAAVAGSAAVRTAQQQRPVTYKPQLDQYQARGQAVQAQLKPLYEKIERDSQAPAAKTPAGQQGLQQQAAMIQQIEQNAQRELNEILRPVAYSEAYVVESVEEKLTEAVQKAMVRRKITLVLQPGALVARANAYDLTKDIVAELDALVPNVSVVPPQGWEPRQLREARAAQAAQQAGAQAPAAPAPVAPAGPQPEGR